MEFLVLKRFYKSIFTDPKTREGKDISETMYKIGEIVPDIDLPLQVGSDSKTLSLDGSVALLIERGVIAESKKKIESIPESESEPETVSRKRRGRF